MDGSIVTNPNLGEGMLCLYQSIIQCGDCFRLKNPMSSEKKHANLLFATSSSRGLVAKIKNFLV